MCDLLGLNGLVLKFGFDGVVIAHAIQDRALAGNPLIVKIGVGGLRVAAVVTRMQSKGNIVFVVVDVFDHAVPEVEDVVGVREVNELQGRVGILEGLCTRCRSLHDKGLDVAVELDDIRHKIISFRAQYSMKKMKSQATAG